MPIDQQIAFIALKIAILSVSDTRNKTDDVSGQILIDRLTEAGHLLADHKLVKDEQKLIEREMLSVSKDDSIDVLICTGGTGITARDVTPEAFNAVVHKRLDGFGEIFRMQSFAKIGSSAIQSRACAGTIGDTSIFVLPGSPSACQDAWDLIVEMLDNRFKPCNLSMMRERM